MIIENQVCSFELAKKLLTLGVKQNSWFFYTAVRAGSGKNAPLVNMITCLDDIFEINGDEISAFTASELLEILPNGIDTKNNEPFNHFRFNLQRSLIVKDKTLIKIFSINYHCDTIQFESGSPFFALGLFKHNIYDENLANALAKTLIKLMEEKLWN